MGLAMITLRQGQDVAAGAVSAMSAAAGWTVDSVSLTYLGVPLATLLLAFAGSVISLTWVKSNRKWWVVVGAGTFIGAVCAPLVAWGAGMTPEKAVALEKALAFVLGLGVQVVVPALLQWIENRGKR